MRPTAKPKGNFIDTANVYTNGSSERFMGAHQDHRQSAVLATRNATAQTTQRAGQSSQKHDSSRGGDQLRLDAVQLQSRLNSSLRRSIDPWSSVRRFTMF